MRERVSSTTRAYLARALSYHPGTTRPYWPDLGPCTWQAVGAVRGDGVGGFKELEAVHATPTTGGMAPYDAQTTLRSYEAPRGWRNSHRVAL